MSIGWNYDGAANLIVTLPTSTVGWNYTLLSNDSNSSPDGPIAGTGAALVLSISDIGGESPGDVFDAYVYADGPSSHRDYPAANILTYGTSLVDADGSPVTPDTWAYDGVQTFSDMFTAPVSGDYYSVGVDYDDGTGPNSTNGFESIGTGSILRGVMTSLPIRAGAICRAMMFRRPAPGPIGPFIPQAVRLFVAGTASSGYLLDPPTPPTPSPPEGISIAFDDGPLVASPVWTRIDNHQGVTIQEVTIERGRMDETTKVAVGICKISGTDRVGALDPTNATGPFYGKLDPVKQVAVTVWDPTDGGGWFPHFTGYWDDLSYVIDPSGKFATFELDCVDGLDILTDAEVIAGAAGSTAPAASTGNAFYAAQQVNDRINAALADSATALLGVIWPPEKLNIFSGNVELQDSVYSPRSPLLQVIQDACDGEFPMVSIFYVDRNGVFNFKGRYARFNPTDVHYEINFWKVGDEIAFNADNTYARITPTTPFQFTRGKANLINASYCSPQGIAASAVAGQLVSDSTSIGKYMVRSSSYEGLLTQQGDEGSPLDADHETRLMGQYQVDNYKAPQNRPRRVTIMSIPPPDPRSDPVWDLLSGIELSDVVTLWTTHPGGGGFTNVDFFVEKITETITPRDGEETGDQVVMTLEISPRAYFDSNPWITDS